MRTRVVRGLVEQDPGITLRNPGALARPRLVFFEHDFGGFDYGFYGVADFEFHIFGAASGDDAFNEVIAYAHDHMSHDSAQLKFFNLASEFIASR
jgi:hypothetical protein